MCSRGWRVSGPLPTKLVNQPETFPTCGHSAATGLPLMPPSRRCSRPSRTLGALAGTRRSCRNPEVTSTSGVENMVGGSHPPWSFVRSSGVALSNTCTVVRNHHSLGRGQHITCWTGREPASDSGDAFAMPLKFGKMLINFLALKDPRRVHGRV